MPGTYEHLDSYVRILPGNNTAVSAPFLGLVINLNVVTAAHRDSKDDGVCLVLAIGDFEGGELVLYEPGLVVPLRNGDFVIFPSCKSRRRQALFKGKDRTNGRSPLCSVKNSTCTVWLAEVFVDFGEILF